MGSLGGCLTVFGVLFALGLIAQIGTYLSSTGTNPATNRERSDPKVVVIPQVKLSFTWSKGGFDNVMEANFTVQNNSDVDIKDFEITCQHSAASGTIIDRNVRTIYDVVKAHSKRRFPNFNMGLIHSQAVRSSCAITDLMVVQ